MSPKKTEGIKKVSRAQTKRLGQTETVTGSTKFSDLQDGYSASDTLTYSFSPWLIIAYAQQDPVIRAAINKKANKVMSEGYSLEPIDNSPEAEREIEEFEEFAKTAGGRVSDSGKQVNFDGVLFNTLLGLGEGDELYWEIRNTESGVPGEINNMDWEDMRVALDKSPKGKRGKIARYLQIKNGRKVADWAPEEMIHRSMFVKGTRLYGNSLIISVMNAAAGRGFAIKYANNVFINQKPKGIWSMDVSDEDYKKIKDQIKEGKQNPHQDITLQTRADKMGYQNIATSTEMEYKEFIKDFRIEILVGMGVPPGSVYLPGETGGWEADVQLHEFDEDINRIRTFMEGIVNEQIFPRFGFTHIKFKINRSNKRDELKEAQIAVMLKNSGITTVNETRELLGYGEVEEGDQREPQSSGGFGSNMPSGEGNSSVPESSQDNQLEGQSAGEKETVKSYPVTYKNPNYFKKSYGSNSLFNKSKSKRTIKIKNKRGPKLNRLIKDYSGGLDILLKEYIDRLKTVVLDSDISGVFSKIRTRRKLEKITNPSKETELFEVIRREFMSKSRDLSRQFARSSYDFGIDMAEIETGVGFSKVALAPETIDFLENMNIDLVEGAFSEVAQRAKTQIRTGMLEGEGPTEIARRLDQMKGSVEAIYKNRTKTIARTEVMRASNRGSLEAYKNSGTITKVQVLIGIGPDDSRICASTYEGQEGSLSKVWDINNLPAIPAHPNCTCVVVPVIE